jgi:hypothetical protein
MTLLPHMTGHILATMCHKPERLAGSEKGADFDVLTEISFARREAYDQTMAGLADPLVQHTIAEEEERFIDRSWTRFFLVDLEMTKR